MTVIVRSETQVIVAPSGVSGLQGPPGPPGSGSTIGVKDEGSLLSSTVQRLNFTGAGVTASGSGADVDITIPGGGGSSFVTPQQFGAVGDNSTDDGPAFAAMLASIRTNALSNAYGYSKGGSMVFIPKGRYFLNTTTLDLTVTTHIFGEGGCGPEGPASVLRWAANTTGIRLQAGNTSGASSTQTEDGTGADGSIIRGLGLLGSKVNGGTGADGNYHAIHARTTFSAADLYIEGWQGDGIYSISTGGGGGASEGNSNNMRIHNIYFENCRRAMFLDGADTNAGYYSGFNIKNMRAEGIYDSCFLNSTHIGHHTTGCAAAPFKCDGVNARIAWIGCYTEGGQPACDIIFPSTVIGGIFGDGFVVHAGAGAGSRAMMIGPGDVGQDLLSQNPSTLGATTGRYTSGGGLTNYGIRVHNSSTLASSNPSLLDFAQGYETDGVTPCRLAAIYSFGNGASPTGLEAKLIFATRAFSGGAMTDRLTLDAINQALFPATDNNYTLGLAANRWSIVYAGTGTINTSDERQKQSIAKLDGKLLDAWAEIDWQQYQWKDAVTEKGEDGARIHTGLIAQQVKKVLEAKGLDGFRYGLLCYDEWEDEFKPVTKQQKVYKEREEYHQPKGKKRVRRVVKEHVGFEEVPDLDSSGKQKMELVRPAGNRFGIRYEEALAVEAAYQRRRADSFETRLAALEAKS